MIQRQTIVANDWTYGRGKEREFLPVIQQYLPNIQSTETLPNGKFFPFDFYDPEESLYVELKSRRDNIRHDKYDTAVFPRSKIDFAQKNNSATYWLFIQYTDGWWGCKIDDEIKALPGTTFFKNNGEVPYNVKIPITKLVRLEEVKEWK